MYKLIGFIVAIALWVLALIFLPAFKDVTWQGSLAWFFIMFFFGWGYLDAYMKVVTALEDRAFKKRNDGKMIKVNGRRFESVEEYEDYMGWWKRNGE